MPWLALPFNDRTRKAELSKKYKVQGIPTLVLIDETGKTITLDGRSAVTNDPQGNNFPWTPKTLAELLEGDLRKNDGSTVPFSSLAGKSLALYFSAHWCPPCRGFTPKLAELYNSMKSSERSNDFEFIFISSDRDEASFNEYHGEQPWLALPFNKRSEKEELSNMFGVQGIPTLVTIDSNGKVINKNARGAASDANAAENFPWKPNTMEDLSKTVEANGFNVNEIPSVILFCDGASNEMKKQCSDELLLISKEYSDNVEEPEFIFFIASAHQGPVPQVKKLISFQEELIEEPTIVILDIPDNGGFYTDKLSNVNNESIKNVLNKYKNKELTRSQMSR
mmetsp:Transcript_37731/g.48850  ORF Transcript_37731/g.48850 Transcript_37731/m.48850 type:complete len:337 (+) Transcript_37731:377-1387(+)